MKKFGKAIAVAVTALLMITTIALACHASSINILIGDCNFNGDGRSVTVSGLFNVNAGYRGVVSVDGSTIYDETYSAGGDHSYSDTDTYSVGSHTATASLYQPIVIPAVTETSCPINQPFSETKMGCPTDPAAYTSDDSSLPCNMKFGQGPGRYTKYADEVVVDSVNISFNYDKWAQDPNKCHRPTAESLGIPNWAKNDFNNQYPEWADASVVIITPATTDWRLIDSKSATFTIEGCASQYCQATTLDETVWGEWILAADGLSKTRTGTIAIWDSTYPTYSCGTLPAEETQYLYCNPDGSTTDWYYEGKEPNGATIGECPIPPTPGSASVTVGACHWVDGQSVKDVAITIDNATVNIVDVGDYATSETIQLPSGNYNCTWSSVDPYVGNGDCSFVVEASCAPLPPPPPSENNMIIPVTGGNQTAAVAVGISLLAGLGLVFAALKKLIK